MAAWALWLYGGYLALAFGVRTILHLRRTGETGWVRPANVAAWVSEGLLTLGGAATLAGPISDLAGAWAPLAALDATAARAVGITLALFGIVLAGVAQVELGGAWRAGVDPAVRTDLVTSGVFGAVRNPFYVSMMLASAGVALLSPTAVALVGLALTIVGAEAVVRLVEEPYLRSVHGDTYVAYLERTGRFVPARVRTNGKETS